MLENFNIFDECKRIYNLDNENEQRNETIKLLDKIKDEEYPPILNHLLRDIGLYPYMQEQNSIFDDKFLLNCFKVDIGEDEPKVLHIKQSWILKKLLNGENLIVSAPTSFGKSFIIDALIANKKPNNIVIIVPTISLMDETRRRLTKKFGKEYNIITTSGSEVKDKNIFVFPQERAFNYTDDIKKNGLDLFIVDEFYKISSNDDRSGLLKTIISKFAKFAKQRYYLCPNKKLSNMKNSVGTKNMRFLELDFNTVFLNEIKEYCKDDNEKIKKTKQILQNNPNKQTLIYANTKTTIEKIVKNIITDSPCNEKLLSKYATWIKTNYSKNWFLYNGLLNGICVHYGKLHRHITQMNVKLYNDRITQTMICTSSLIEGVNTSSENLIMFSNILGNRNNRKDLDFFTYKNIIGRSGRAFRYFIGNCYLLAKEPQKDDSENLEIKPSKDDYLTIDDELDYTEKIINEAKKAKDDILNIINKKFADEKQSRQKQRKILRLLKDGKLKTNVDNIIKVIEILCSDGFKESSLEYLNNDNPEKWGAFVTFQKIYQIHEIISKDKLTKYYQCKDNSIKQILENMQWKNITKLFDFEYKISNKLAKLFSDVNELQKIIFDDKNIDISKMVQRMYNLFMPSKILQLEEYGLPRMITKKLIGILPNIENEEISIMTLLEEFKELGPNNIINYLKENNKFCDFDDEFIKYFFEGIS